jgi:hypothetical protein
MSKYMYIHNLHRNISGSMGEKKRIWKEHSITGSSRKHNMAHVGGFDLTQSWKNYWNDHQILIDIILITVNGVPGHSLLHDSFHLLPSTLYQFHLECFHINTADCR